MADKMTIEERKGYAKLLFLKENLTQKEISKRTGVSAVSINKWVKEWEHLKLNLMQTREERFISTLIQLSKLDEEIANIGYPDSKQADIRRKLTADLEALEREASIRDIVEVQKQQLIWLRATNPKMGELFAPIMNDFIKYALSKK